MQILKADAETSFSIDRNFPAYLPLRGFLEESSKGLSTNVVFYFAFVRDEGVYPALRVETVEPHAQHNFKYINDYSSCTRCSFFIVWDKHLTGARRVTSQ